MGPSSEKARIEPNKEAVTAAANDESLRTRRYELPKFSSEHLAAAGMELELLGRIVGSDRADGTSP